MKGSALLYPNSDRVSISPGASRVSKSCLRGAMSIIYAVFGNSGTAKSADIRSRQIDLSIPWLSNLGNKLRLAEVRSASGLLPVPPGFLSDLLRKVH